MKLFAPALAMLLALAFFSERAVAAAVPTAVFANISGAISAGEGAKAVALVDAALGARDLDDLDRARLFWDRGLGDHLQANANDALSDLTQAINMHVLPDAEQANAFLERGLVLDGMGRLDDAIGDYSAALRLVPNSATALNNRANAFRRQKHFEEARRDYLASLAADNPAPEYPYYGLGQIAENQNRPDEARNFYAHALAANPGYGLAEERLTALGGAPGSGAITLHPPKSTPPKAVSVAQDAPLALRPPTAKRAVTKDGFVPVQPSIKPAGYSGRDPDPGLRPALDNPGGPVGGQQGKPGASREPGGQQVQLGAWRDEAEAAEGWNRAVKQAGGALEGFSPQIVAVDLPGRGRYFRLRVTAPDGKGLCNVLTAKGLDCIPARN
jgi:tetratricopeptide (TPR) repeat protein